MTIRKLLYLLLLPTAGVLLAGSCKPTSDDKPDDLIPRAQMVDILTDIHIAEAKAGRLGIPSTDSSGVVYRRFERDIHRKYKIDTAVYHRSYRYYAAHPKELEAIYEDVVARLKARTEPPTDSTKKRL